MSDYTKHCRDYNRKMYHERKAKGLCVRCGCVTNSSLYCEECTIKREKEQAKYRKKKARKLANQTQSQPKPKLLPTPRYDMIFLREYRKANKLCVVCGAKAGLNYTMCDEHRLKQNEQQRKSRANKRKKGEDNVD